MHGEDYKPEYLFDFLNEAYRFRSKLVHGKIGKKVSRLSKYRKFRLNEVAIELEQITRLSILRVLSIFKHYNYKQEFLINVIDKVAIGYPRGTL